MCIGCDPAPADTLTTEQADDALIANEVTGPDQYEVGAAAGEVTADGLSHGDVALVEQLCVEGTGQFGVAGLYFEEPQQGRVITGKPGGEHVGNDGFDLGLLVESVGEQLNLSGHGLVVQQCELRIEAFQFQYGAVAALLEEILLKQALRAAQKGAR